MATLKKGNTSRKRAMTKAKGKSGKPALSARRTATKKAGVKATSKRGDSNTGAGRPRNANRSTAAKTTIAKKSPLLRQVVKKTPMRTSSAQSHLNLYSVPVLALHDVRLIDTQRLALPPGDVGERKMSVKLTYVGAAEKALLSVFVFNRATEDFEGKGIAIRPDANGAGEFVGAAGVSYIIFCWFTGVAGSSIKLVVSYPAAMHIDDPAGQLTSADTEIDPSSGSNLVQLIFPANGGLR